MTRLALLAALTLALTAPAADPPKPAVEVRLVPAADLGPAVEYLFATLGQETMGQDLAKGLPLLADNPSLAAGLDLKKPAGGYVVMADKVEESTVVLLLPVGDEKAFLAAVKGLSGAEPKKDAKSDTYSADVPNFTTVYFRFADGYAYATLRSADGVSKDKLLAPKAFFAPKQDGLLTADVFFDRIPADLRKAVYGQLELQLKERAKGEENAAKRLLNEFVIDVGVDAIKTLLTDGESLHLSLNVDPKADDVLLAVTVTPKAGTTLAKTLSGWADRDSKPAAVAAKNPLLAVGLNFALPPQTAKKLGALADDLGKEADDGQRMVFNALAPTLKAGDLRAKVVLTADAKGKPSVSGAATVAEGKGIEKAAKALLAHLQPSQGEFTPDADKAGVHKLTLADSPLASGTVWIHTADDLIAVDSGEKADGVKAIAGAKAAKAPMLQLVVSATQFARIGQGYPEEVIKNVVTSVFDGKADGLDTLTLTATGGKQLTLNAALKGKAFAFMVALDKAK